EKIERIQKKNLWQGMEEKFKFHLVAWDKVCTPKSMGGLGIKNIEKMNEALIAKMGWRLLSEKQPWIDVIKAKYLNQQAVYSYLHEEQLPNGSIFWNNLVKSRNFIKQGSKWKVGDGSEINFWEDNWFSDNLLERFGTAKDSLISKYGTKVKDYIEGNGTNKTWKRLSMERIELKQITSSLQDLLDLFPLSQLNSKDEL
ncbi:hypothetical protein KI387_041863, partial [Taxus chinensis]